MFFKTFEFEMRRVGLLWRTSRLISANGRDITKRAIIDVNSIYIVSERNDDILTSIIAQLLTSWPFPDLCHSPLSTLCSHTKPRTPREAHGMSIQLAPNRMLCNRMAEQSSMSPPFGSPSCLHQRGVSQSGASEVREGDT